MYEIRILKGYKKQYKKLSIDNQILVDSIVQKLANDEPLEKKYQDHKLKGEFKDFRECHIKPDLLLVYQKQENLLILTCVSVGSHSELFR
ncbi:type II toxin-antitoxin system YafQ family toxin [Helicobacter aurati]|uniref:Type II toxin-antitoxin system YafQ family toxin n=1 Tax=Helicobacter aurati TaxID=137778 RepID=A0A3D8IXS5_9HELI|nr:type II toxin-antitoxin system YafQ family toxin [Helicobacter aurati]RDU69776.1 type II toxin-antitoxin system YafQ family toxin [Helicobacter aurati]